MKRRWSRLAGWLIGGGLIGGLSSAVDGFLLGLLGGVVFSDDPVQSGLFLALILGGIGTVTGAFIGAIAGYVLPKLVLKPPGE